MTLRTPTNIIALGTAIAVFIGAVTMLHSATVASPRVQPGMKGYGLTVFKGTQVERFDVEVIDIVPNFMLKQDIILVRCHHPVTDHAGVIGGMSGSPIYIEGRLVGALAYGWRFNKDPMAGVTPIENMRQLLTRPPRERPSLSRKASMMALQNPVAFFRQKIDNTHYTRLKHLGEGNLVPARMPLSLSGITGEAKDILEQTLSPFGLDPMQGGGSGSSSSDDPDELEAGGAIGVQMIRGDLSATGIGTVTSVKGSRVLAFGHPMLNMGESYLPVTTARIHTVIPSLARSNKLGSPLKEAGSLVQDRMAGIVAHTDIAAKMIPVVFNIEDTARRTTTTYNVEVADRDLLTSRLINAALVQFIQHGAADATDVSATIKGRVKIQGYPTYSLGDSGVSRSGLQRMLSFFRPITLLHALLNNPFEDIVLERVEFDVRLRYELAHDTVMDIYMTAGEPSPGELVNIHVRLKSYGGSETLKTIPFRIPQGLAAEKVKLTVGGGNSITPRLANPESISQFMDELKKLYPARSLVLQLEVPAQTLSLRGKTLKDLPPSAAAALNPQAGDYIGATYKTIQDLVIPMNNTVSGQQSFSFTVGRQTHQ